MYIQRNDADLRRHLDTKYFRYSRRAKLGMLWSTLTRRQNNHLPSFKDIQQELKLRTRRNKSMQLVPLTKIVGSEGRCQDFDAQFRPLNDHSQARWVRIAMAHYYGIGLPAVELMQVDDRYYVVDGHHRISFAKAIGQHDIDAHVTVWHTTANATCQATTETCSGVSTQRYHLRNRFVTYIRQRLSNLGNRDGMTRSPGHGILHLSTTSEAT